MKINNKIVDSVFMNNKELRLIRRVNDNVIIYEKSQEIVEPISRDLFAHFDSSPVKLRGLRDDFDYTYDHILVFGEDVYEGYIDWGDENREFIEVSFYDNGGSIEHYYEESSFDYYVTIEDVSYLGMGLFRGCTNLIDIEIPETITELRRYLFEGCTSLQNITIPSSVTTIDEHCFDGCSDLYEVNLPDGVFIGTSAFKNCTSLDSLELPNNFELDDYAFYGCDFYELYIPATIPQYVDYESFTNCHISTCYLNWEGESSYYMGYFIGIADEYSIPYGTTQMYIDLGYPSDKLVERNP